MRRYLGVRFITTALCLASASVLVPARGAQAQTCQQWADSLAQMVEELRAIRVELRDLEVEYSEERSKEPSNKEKWITDEIRRLAAAIEDTRAAAAASGCNATSSISTTVNGRATLFNAAQKAFVETSLVPRPILSLTLAGDRVTLSSGPLVMTEEFGFASVTVAGVLSVPCLETRTLSGSGSGGRYDSASGHIDLPMTVMVTRSFRPATSDVLELVVCRAVVSRPEVLSTNLTTRSMRGRPLNKSTGDVALDGQTVFLGEAWTLRIGGTMSPIFP